MVLESNEIISLYKNDQNYLLGSYVSEWFNVGSIETLRITTFLNTTYDLVVDFAIDENLNIIDTDTTAGLTNYNSSSIDVKARFVRVSIDNILASPAILELQVFYNK